MFYVIQVQYNKNDSMYHFDVGIVWGEGYKQAYEKAQRLFSAYEITKFEMNPLDLDGIKKIATLGGAIVASFEDFYE